MPRYLISIRVWGIGFVYFYRVFPQPSLSKRNRLHTFFIYRTSGVLSANTCTMSKNNGNPVTVREFIEEYLIRQIGEIKNDYPYLAFVLMSVGIEFLGKCQNTKTNWQYNDSANDFKLGMSLFSNSYNWNAGDLYSKLRCGMAHALQTKQIDLSDTGNCNNGISCDMFYDDFVSACKALINKNPPIQTQGKRLSDVFFYETQSTDKSGLPVTSTGQTSTNKTKIK